MAQPVMLRNLHSHLFSSAALPALVELFRMEYGQTKALRDKLFKIVPADKDIVQSSELHDLDRFSEVADGEDYPMKRPKQGASKTLTHIKYGLGVSASEELIDDGRFSMLEAAIRKMARSARESKEVLAANILNNGFSGAASPETTADGVSIFSASHTLPSGGTLRNLLSTAADLSVTSLEQALLDFDTVFVGDTGIINKIQPRFLVVHPSNKRYALELVGSDLKPDTADNNMNSFQGEGLQVISSPHLTDSDAWFLVADPLDTGLRVYERWPLEIQTAGPDVGFMNDALYVKARFRESLGCMHPFGIFGTPGA